MKAGDCTRVYTRAGARTHLLYPWDSPNDSWSTALCTLDPDTHWLGTGSQDEHDRAAALPLCARCRAVLHRTEAG